MEKTAQCNSRWFTDEVLQLIDIVKSCECIYNPKHKHYFCRPYVENLWKEIDLKLGKPPGASLSKWTNLRICFRREYTTFLKEKTKPYWAFFDKMFFLREYLRQKRPIIVEGLESHIQEALEKVNSITRGNFKNFVEHVEDVDTYEEEDDEVEEEGVWDESGLIKKEDTEDDTEQEYIIENYTTEALESNSTEQNRSILKRKTLTETQRPDYVSTISECSSNHRGTTYSSDSVKLMPSSTTQEEFAQKRLKYQRNSIDLSQTVQLDSNAMPKDDREGKISTYSENSALINKEQKNNSPEMCACKSDSDAMFLMSLLPDIQSLTRKDKGKFKIEIQKIVQELLYPDD